MSFARSASGPAGGLSINTGAANSLAPSGSLFGSNSAAPTNTNTSTTGTTSMTSAAGGLFGAVQPVPATPAGLFGAPLKTTTTAPPAAGLFGAVQPVPATPAGLFGASNKTPAQTGTGAGTGASSLFGGGAQNQQQPQTQTGGGLFGNAAPTQTQQQSSTTGGLFGSTLNKPQQANATGLGGSLFGQSTQNQQGTQQSGGGLFGGMGNQQSKDQGHTQSAGGLFGQSQPAQQNQSTGQMATVQINYDNVRPRSRFDDLAKPVQDEIALIDRGVQRVMKMKDEISGFMPQHERDIEQLGRDVKFVESKFNTVQMALNQDIQTVKGLQDLTKKNVIDARLSFTAADNLKLPAHYHQTSLFAAATPSSAPATGGDGDGASANGGAQDLITYFNRICDDVEKYKARLDEYRAAIERDMPGVEHGLFEQIRAFRDRNAAAAALGGAGAGMESQLNGVLSAIRDTGAAIIAQAGQIADTRERLSRLQAGMMSSGMYSLGVAA